MDQQGPQGFWTNMAVQRPVIETNSATNPTSVLGGPPARSCQPDSLLDGEKTGVALLLSGLLLTLLGVTFTAMGWQHYLDNSNFLWTRLLGPILISVGGTFMLTSVCKFGIFSCLSCRQWDEETLVTPVMEQSLTGHSFTLSAISLPVMLHSVTAGLCMAPPYNVMSQEVGHATEFQLGRSVNAVHATHPSLDAVRCVYNAAFTAEEDSSVHSRETDHRNSR